jgi:uncharacterized membrane protein YcfT
MTSLQAGPRLPTRTRPTPADAPARSAVLHSSLHSSTLPMAARKPAPAAVRSIWMDTAKGLCILLVVSWHVIWKSYLHLDWAEPGLVGAAWSAFGRALLPMRMPLFFLISGMLAVAAAARPWRTVARSKVARFGYLYLLWLLVHTLVLIWLPIPFDTEIARDAWELLEQATILPTALWYLFALALYFVIGKLVRGLPPALVLGAAFLFSAASSAGWIYSPANNATLYQNLFFFLAGLYLRRHVEDMARWASWWQVVGTGLAFGVCLLVLLRFDAMTVPGVWPLTSTVATIFAVLAMARVARWRIGNTLAKLGRRTLPIYLMHLPMLAYAHWLLSLALPGLPGPVRLAMVLVEPVLLTALLVSLCLGAERLLLKINCGWLFDLPGGKPAPAPAPAPKEGVTDQIPVILETTVIPVPTAAVPWPRLPDPWEVDDLPTNLIPVVEEETNLIPAVAVEEEGTGRHRLREPASQPA